MGGIATFDHPFVDEGLGIDVADLFVLANRIIHQRLGKLGLITFIVAEAAIAPHVDHDIALEFLAIIDCQLASESHRFRVVAIDVQDRRLNALCHVRRVGRSAREFRSGCEPDLVVDDEVDAAAGVVAVDPCQAQAFPYNALARESCIAVDQDRQHLFVLVEIVTNGLLRAGLAQHNRVNRFEVGRVGDERHMHFDPVKLAVCAGTQVIVHVARAADILRTRRSAGKFVEDHSVWLGHDVREYVETSAVRHPVDDLADAVRAAILDHRFERGDHCFAAIEAKALGADILLREEVFVFLAADHRLQDCALAFLGELDRFARALELVLQESPLFGVGDVHVFEAHIAAIGRAQGVVELADGGPAEAHHTA